MSPSARDRTTIESIRQILERDWESMSVLSQRPRAEQEAYLDSLYRLLLYGDTVAAIATHFCSFERVNLGLRAVVVVDRMAVAEKLKALPVDAAAVERLTTYRTSREIPAPVAEVFAAIGDPERLARWWGPAGFTNTFSVCEFREGGRWSFMMHEPLGRSYVNECVFATIDAPTRIVVDHVSSPKYRLTIDLAESPAGTIVSWCQVFEDARAGERLASIVVPANEENLDRLTDEVLAHRGDGRALSDIVP